MKYLLCGIYLILSVAGLTFMKLGAMDSENILFSVFNISFTWKSILGYLFYAISFLIYSVVITKFDLSYIIPIVGGIANVMVLLVGVGVLNEVISGKSLLGTGFIIVGIFLMNLK